MKRFENLEIWFLKNILNRIRNQNLKKTHKWFKVIFFCNTGGHLKDIPSCCTDDADVKRDYPLLGDKSEKTRVNMKLKLEFE